MARRGSPVRHFLFTTGLVAVATLITINVEPIRTGIPFALYFATIGICSWFCGKSWGWWTIALSLLATLFCVFQTAGLGPRHFLQLGVLGAVACTLNGLIGALQTAQRRIQRDEETLTTTLLSIGDAVIATDPGGRVQFMNGAAEKLTGYSSREAANQPLAAVFNILNEGTRTPVGNPVQRVIESGLVVGLTQHTIVRAKNGVETPIEDSAAPIRTANGEIIGVVMVFHDVTEKRLAQRELKEAHDQLEIRVRERTHELRESEERARLLVESVADYAIYSLDLEGRVTSWNAGLKRIKGYEADEIIGKPFSIFFLPEAAASGKPAQLLAEAARSGRVQDEGWRARKDGSRFWANAIITALKDESGAVIGFAKVTRDMTAELQARKNQQKLFESEVAREQAELVERRIVSILNTITDGYLSCDKNWHVTFVNPEAEKAAGPREKILGKSHWELFPATLGTIVEREYRRAVATNTPVEFENFYEPLSKWFSVKAYPTADGLSIFFRDVTAQKYAEAALRAESERLRVTLTSIGDAVIVTNTAAHVTMLNPIAEMLTGWSSADAAGRPLDEVFNIVSEHTRERATNPAVRALAEGAVVGLANHTILIARNGAENPIDDSAAPIKDESGRVLGVVLVFRDITEKKKAETERADLLKREQESRQAAEHANRLKDEFLAIVSHELRTPLTPILGWASLLKAPNLTQEHLIKGLDVIERNVAVQKRVIEDLLDVSRIISGKLLLDFQPVELNLVLEQAIETIRSTAKAKNIEIEVKTDSAEYFVNGDSARLQQAIWNLLGNAVKFTPKGGRVSATLARMGSQVELKIQDNGLGIDPAFLPSLFNRFSQADSSTARVHGGLGLGLAIAKHVIEAHRGKIAAESAGVGKGATFKVSLPVVPLQTRSDFAQSGVSAGDALSVSDLTVLVVDDDADARELIAAILTSAGARVTTAGSAAEALDQLAKARFDLLISDIGMPHEDGYSLIRKIRQRKPEDGGQTPAIAVTAFAKAENQAAALSAGFQAHLAKPMDPGELLRVAATIVAQFKQISRPAGVQNGTLS